MTTETLAPPRRPWTIEGFAAFWAKPDLSMVPAVRAAITDDIAGHWPRPIGTVRGADNYLEVIAAVLKACPDWSVRVAESAQAGDFHFVRWIATGTGPEGRFEFTGCDRVRTRGGQVCENYVFCDHPFFASVAERLAG